MVDLDEVVIIDVSKWQGVMDWEVARSKIHGAYIKATEGTGLVDAQYERNRLELERHEIPWGAYHFFRPEQDPKRQARFFAETIGRFEADGKFVLDCNLRPALDVETKPPKMTKAAMKKAVETFLAEFEAITGVTLMIYTRASFWDKALPRTNLGSKHWLWVAHYSGFIVEPWVPLDWQDQGWKMWQWSADGNGRGAEFGAQSKSIDINRYRGGLEQFYKDYKLPMKEIEKPGETVTARRYRALSPMNVRDEIIPGRNGSKKGYKASKVWFVLSAGAVIEALEEVRDGENEWVRVGQRQYVAKVYDGQVYLV